MTCGMRNATPRQLRQAGQDSHPASASVGAEDARSHRDDSRTIKRELDPSTAKSQYGPVLAQRGRFQPRVGVDHDRARDRAQQRQVVDRVRIERRMPQKPRALPARGEPLAQTRQLAVPMLATPEKRPTIVPSTTSSSVHRKKSTSNASAVISLTMRFVAVVMTRRSPARRCRANSSRASSEIRGAMTSARKRRRRGRSSARVSPAIIWAKKAQ